MSADREMDHLENMSDMNGSRHWNQPYCYATTGSQDAEADRLHQALAAAHAQIYVTAVSQIEEPRK
jgi:hypothetical protein